MVFCQNSRLIERYRQQIAAAPEDAANYFRLARAAEGDRRRSRWHSRCTAGRSRRHGRTRSIDGLSLGGCRAESEIPSAGAAGGIGRARRGKWDVAAERLKSAANVARSGERAARGRSSCWPTCCLTRREPRDAVAICQRLLADERLRSLPVAAADGHRTVRADLLIADRLKSIVERARPSGLRALRQGSCRHSTSAARKRKIAQVLDHGLPRLPRGARRSRCAARAGRTLRA